jgi:hypothetical protein
VQLLQLIEPAHRPLLQLGARADQVQLSARARVEGQRQTEVALARDVPVAHVGEPVVHALAVLRRRPLDPTVLLAQLLPHLVDADEPVVDHPEDEWRAAAPADRVAVGDPPRLDQQAAVAQRLDHRLLDLAGRHPGERAVLRVEASTLVDRDEHR